ncbi:MAG: DUF459 domain-containing protein [Acidimicrobiales bacterium]
MSIFRKAPSPAGRPGGRKGEQPRDGRRVRPAPARSASANASRRRSSTSARPRAARPAPTTTGRGPVPRTKPRQVGEGGPTDQRRRASAGRIIGVGLVCFGIWLAFDANQLYHAAEAGQIGVRRTVAMAVLRPIAAVTDALRISGPVNSADSALGRCGIGGAPACISGPAPTPTVNGPVHRSWGYLGLGGAPHLGPGIHYVPPPPPPVEPSGPPPIASPTTSHPLTLLSIGDSIGEDLGFGLGDVFSTDPDVRVVQKALEDTGLARSDYYNWPVALEADLRQYHPEIVVVMLGANDMQYFSTGNGHYISFSLTASQWWQAYAHRVALVMDEATAAGAHVMWVGLPPMGAGSTVPAGFPQKLNGVFYAESNAHPGVAYFPAASVLAGRKGGFQLYMTINGSIEQIRSTDGVHLLPAGYDMLAQALVEPMERAWNVNLHVG